MAFSGSECTNRWNGQTQDLLLHAFEEAEAVSLIFCIMPCFLFLPCFAMEEVYRAFPSTG